MKLRLLSIATLLQLSALPFTTIFAQQTNTTTVQKLNKTDVNAIIKEANEHSHLEQYAYELLDLIGPRLVGSPQMLQANNWVVETYKKMGIVATNEAYGEWKAWQRGNTSIELITPRVQQLRGMQLAWNVNLKKPIQATTIIMPYFKTEAEFDAWKTQAKGKLVLIAPYYNSGRPLAQWKENALEEDYLNYKKEYDSTLNAFNSFKATLNKRVVGLEQAGAAGIIHSQWTGDAGSNRVFDSKTTNIPSVDIQYEDYALLYRLTKNGAAPTVKINTQSKDLGKTTVYNTVATIPGTSKSDEYILLSAHLDSWDGAQGACDNGTGTILMMEVARIIKAVCPNPTRTIIIGHWGSEEQGLNGSRAFVKDHPELMSKIKASFNQDSGTGRINAIDGQGFLNSYDYLTRWLSKVPEDIKKEISTSFPGTPQVHGTDNVSFVAAGVPAFNLRTQSWNYRDYTWHTVNDTHDKIVWSEMKRNAITTAILAIEAANDPNEISNERRLLPMDENGNRGTWPDMKAPERKGRL